LTSDSAEARQNRFALAQLAALLRGDTDGDDSNEESAVVAQFTPLPDIEVSKLVRCADDDASEFVEGPIDALAGSTVEYQITIQNLGNTDLEVTVQDVLAEAGLQMDFASCDVVCDFIEAELTSPRRGLTERGLSIRLTHLALGLEDGIFFPDMCSWRCFLLGEHSERDLSRSGYAARCGIGAGHGLQRDNVTGLRGQFGLPAGSSSASQWGPAGSPRATRS
jgi:uncharacterized repeat protein (TIGR01451 family)